MCRMDGCIIRNRSMALRVGAEKPTRFAPKFIWLP